MRKIIVTLICLLSVIHGQPSVELLLTQAAQYESNGDFGEAIAVYIEIVDSDAVGSQKCIAYRSLYDYYQLLGVEIDVDDFFTHFQACDEASESVTEYSNKNITIKKQSVEQSESVLFFDITTGGYSKNTVYDGDTVQLVTYSNWEPSNAFYIESDVDYIHLVDEIEYSGGGSISAEYSRDYDGDTSMDIYAYGRYGIGYKGFDFMPSGGVEYSSDSVVYTNNWNYFLDCYVSYKYSVAQNLKIGLNIGGEYNDYNQEKTFVAYTPLSFRISFWRLRITPGVRVFTNESDNQTIYDSLVFNLGALEEGSDEELIDTVGYTGNIKTVQAQRTLYVTVSTYIRPVDWLKFKIYSGLYSNSRFGNDNIAVTAIDDDEVYGEYLEETTHTQGYFRMVFNWYASFYIGSCHQLTVYSKYSKSTVNSFESDILITYDYQSLVGSSYSSLKLGMEYTYSL